MLNKWILKNGLSTQEFESFPYAFRTMFAIAKKAVQAPDSDKVIEKLILISPRKDIHGKQVKYDYAAAMKMATGMELLTSDGINANEFKQKKMFREFRR